MEVVGAEQQIQWEREEDEREDELHMRRHRRRSSVDVCDVITGDAIQTGAEDKEKDENEGNKSNHELPVSENGESNIEFPLPENVVENGEFTDDLFFTKDCKSKGMLFAPENGESKDKLSVLEDGKSKENLSIPDHCESRDMLFVPENGESKDELSVPGNGHVHISTVSCRYQLNTGDASLSDIKILPPEKSGEDLEITQVSTETTTNGVDTEVPKEGDEELKDFDVERVMKEQNAYDLFCPNCKSCITKRVILRKRKRSIKIVEDGKCTKPEIVDDISGLSVCNQSHTLDSDPAPLPDNRDPEPEVFRCLACFTFFIPTGSGFKLFNVFGDKREKEILQNREQTSAVKKNWLSSLFSSSREEMLVDKDVEASSVATSEREIGTSQSPLVVSSSPKDPEVTGKDVANRGETSDEVQKEVSALPGNGSLPNDQGNPLQSPLVVSSSLKNPEVTAKNEENRGEKSYEVRKEVAEALPGKGASPNEVSGENTIVKPQQDGLKFLVPSSKEASATKKSQPDQKLNTTIGKKGTDDKDSLFPKAVSVYGESEKNKKVDANADFPYQNGQTIGFKQAMPTQSAIEVRNVEVTFNESSHAYGFPHNTGSTKVDIHIENTPKANADAFSPSLTTPLLLPDKQVNTTKDMVGVPDTASAGGDTIITIMNNTQTTTSQPTQNIIATIGTGDPGLTESIEERGFRGVEVIKSIVYGGLVESITSLGVLSSAAGSDTAIINIVALALANLIGGLFVICHHLWELKNDDHGVIYSRETENTPNQGTQRLDKYREILGRRENFLLHATVAIISYIIFGLIPPVIYGFSFRESSDRFFKLIAGAVASLLCITVLAVAKAYVQSPPKSYIKTVFYYIALGFTASSASYVAGDMINKLIQKLGWISSGVDLSVTNWSSY